MKHGKRSFAMFERILVAADRSEQARWAFEAALNLAALTKSQLTLVHVIKSPFDQAPYEEERQSQEILERFAALAPASMKTQIDSRRGNVVAEIIGAAEEINAGLIVMGTHGRGALPQLLLGSTTEGVARWASCPVLTVRQPSAGVLQRILIGVDASEPALAALAVGRDLAEQIGAAVAVVHVADTVHPWQGEMRSTGLAPRRRLRLAGQTLLNRVMADQP